MKRARVNELKEFAPFENKLWLSSPTMHGEEFQYMKEAYDTNWMSTVGTNINEVERLTAETVGCKYVVALSCGTAALHFATKVAGVKPGMYVLVSLGDRLQLPCEQCDRRCCPWLVSIFERAYCAEDCYLR